MRTIDACSLCGGRRWRTREEAAPFRVVECACGLVFVTPQPDRPALVSAYDGDYYEAWDAQAPRRARIWRRRVASVERLVGPGARLLDIGCARGDFLLTAQARGFAVTGTEFSPDAAASARGAGLAVSTGEIWEARLPDGAFDAVTAWHVLEHARDPLRVLGEARRLLRRGGFLVVATPNVDDRIFRAAYRVARRRGAHLFEPDDREVHLFHFSPRTLGAIVARAGLRVRSVGVDRGAAAVPGKAFVNAVASLWFRLSGLNWGMGLELIAWKP